MEGDHLKECSLINDLEDTAAYITKLKNKRFEWDPEEQIQAIYTFA
jgi:hypothetical protein